MFAVLRLVVNPLVRWKLAELREAKSVSISCLQSSFFVRYIIQRLREEFLFPLCKIFLSLVCEKFHVVLVVQVFLLAVYRVN
jgi:hypothetical protein